MSYSLPIITQSAVPSAAGKSRRALELYAVGSNAVFFSNDTDGDVGVSTWQWVLEEQPHGSVVSLLNPTASVCELRADVYGRYTVSLRVNGMGDDTPGYRQIIASCSYPTVMTLGSGDELGDWDPPAHSEGDLADWTDQYSATNIRGGQTEIYRIIDQIRTYMMPFGFKGDTGEVSIPLTLAPRGQTTLTAIQAAAAWIPAGYTPLIIMPPFVQSCIFYAVFGCVGGGGDTSLVRLYNITHAGAVAGSTLSTLVVLDEDSAVLSVGGNPGDMRNDVVARYAVEISINNGALGDSTELYSAHLTLQLG